MENEGITPYILNLGIWWSGRVHAPAVYPWRPKYRRLGGPKTRSERCAIEIPYSAGNQTPIVRLSSPQANRHTERLPHKIEFTFMEKTAPSGRCQGVARRHYCHWTQSACNLIAGFSKINFNTILSSKLWKYKVKSLQIAASQVISSLWTHFLSLSSSIQFEFNRIKNIKTVA